MKKLIWLDLETTGLEPYYDEILEVAAFAADFEQPFWLDDEKGPLYHTVRYATYRPRNEFEKDCGETEMIVSINQPDIFMTDIEPRVAAMHEKSGLWTDCLHAPVLTDQQMDDVLSERIKALLGPEDEAVLAGASIHFDYGFIKAHLPKTAALFSHRLYDTSAVKLFCRSLGMPKLQSGGAHRAVDDVMESVEQARQCSEWLLAGRLQKG